MTSVQRKGASLQWPVLASLHNTPFTSPRFSPNTHPHTRALAQQPTESIIMLSRRELGLAAAGAGALAVAGTADAASHGEAHGEAGVSFNVIYPNHDGARFDAAYYRATHAPMVMRIMNPVGSLLIEGVAPNAPGGAAAASPYAMIGHFRFASPQALDAALANPAMAELRADVANFTDIKPSVMIGRTF
jgi:uncharacterized protein (TIGR02118 family)